MYGGLGQDDMIGGSSDLFGLITAATRPDGSDTIYGGAGIDTGRNHTGDATVDSSGVINTVATGHALDADFLMGDNADVFRLVQGGASRTTPTDPKDVYRVFGYDNYAGTLRIVPRAMKQLDYTLGGADYAGGSYVNGVANADNGAADLIHGESGDDIIFGMAGSDVLFGEGQDDDIVGGYGHDWISGGTGQDGILGDDGLIATSRNGTADPLYNIVATTQQTISTPGQIQYAEINLTGELKKTFDLVPFSYDPSWNALNDEFPDIADATPFADDIIFGGLGSDFLHGGSGDDAISGAEALDHAFVPTYDASGNPSGILDLGYSAVGIPSPVFPGNVLAFNPIDVDGKHTNNRFRPGEFALYDEYDPLRKIVLTDGGELSKTGTGREFLLNFDTSEGVLRPGGAVPKATGQQTSTYGPVRDDGNDVLFGDLGNDWLVGGTGRDNNYGSWGNDLINADDDPATNGTLNDVPDTHPTYEDRAYGGAGRDVLIANTGGDRLIDWVGEYNTYLVPFAPFGMATVSRTLQPQLREFLYALSRADGADPTRASDVGADPLRNGEPAGELGLVLQKDFAWQDQTGPPSDPQAGNIPGGKRDVLRSADFNDGTTAGFAPDSGTWTVSGGALQVAATSLHQDAVSVLPINVPLPSYFEVLASVNVLKPTGGWSANAYIIFDYHGKSDFKFAGVDVSVNKLVMGHRDTTGWYTDVATNFQAKPDTYYNLRLMANGSAASLVIDNASVLSYAFSPRDIDGLSCGLNCGMVGVGSNNARGSFDNVVVQVVPPPSTYQNTEDFSDGVANLFAGTQTGTWTVQNERYQSAQDPGTALGVSLIDLGIGHGLKPNSALDLSALVNTQSFGGIAFDAYSATDFKFVAIDAPNDQVIIGHYTARSGMVKDSVASKVIDAGKDYTLAVTLRGTMVSVTLNGQFANSFVFNAATVDGAFGLLTKSGTSSFDTVVVKTDDPSMANHLQASSVQASTTTGDNLTASTLQPLAAEAVVRWTAALGTEDPRTAFLQSAVFKVTDLPGRSLGEVVGNEVLIDINAGGIGWFVDATPHEDGEFVRDAGGGLVASVGSPAAGRMDLLTVLTHELGHVIGLADLDSGVHADDLMAGELTVGTRRSASNVAALHNATASGPVAVAHHPRVPKPALVAQPPVRADSHPLAVRGKSVPTVSQRSSPTPVPELVDAVLASVLTDESAAAQVNSAGPRDMMDWTFPVRPRRRRV
jgi:Ca2+-binding RTX toxin-like protein